MSDQITDSPYPAIFGAPEIVDRSRILLGGVPAGGPIINDIFYPAVQQALNGEGSVEDIFSTASEQVQAELDG